MKRGITVLLSAGALAAVGYFTASKWAIRHEAITFYDASRENRPVAVDIAVRRDKDSAFIHFADGTSLCFDLAADPSWRTEVRDPQFVLKKAQAMLSWRAQHGWVWSAALRPRLIRPRRSASCRRWPRAGACQSASCSAH